MGINNSIFIGIEARLVSREIGFKSEGVSNRSIEGFLPMKYPFAPPYIMHHIYL